MFKCAAGAIAIMQFNALTLKLVRDECIRKCDKCACLSLQRDTGGVERHIHQQDVTGISKGGTSHCPPYHHQYVSPSHFL